MRGVWIIVSQCIYKTLTTLSSTILSQSFVHFDLLLFHHWHIPQAPFFTPPSIENSLFYQRQDQDTFKHLFPILDCSCHWHWHCHGNHSSQLLTGSGISASWIASSEKHCFWIQYPICQSSPGSLYSLGLLDPPPAPRTWQSPSSTSHPRPRPLGVA